MAQHRPNEIAVNKVGRYRERKAIPSHTCTLYRCGWRLGSPVPTSRAITEVPETYADTHTEGTADCLDVAGVSDGTSRRP
jgi:hypothetical protein